MILLHVRRNLKRQSGSFHNAISASKASQVTKHSSYERIQTRSSENQNLIRMNRLGSCSSHLLMSWLTIKSSTIDFSLRRRLVSTANPPTPDETSHALTFITAKIICFHANTANEGRTIFPTHNYGTNSAPREPHSKPHQSHEVMISQDRSQVFSLTQPQA